MDAFDVLLTTFVVGVNIIGWGFVYLQRVVFKDEIKKQREKEKMKLPATVEQVNKLSEMVENLSKEVAVLKSLKS